MEAAEPRRFDLARPGVPPFTPPGVHPSMYRGKACGPMRQYAPAFGTAAIEPNALGSAIPSGLARTASPRLRPLPTPNGPKRLRNHPWRRAKGWGASAFRRSATRDAPRAGCLPSDPSSTAVVDVDDHQRATAPTLLRRIYVVGCRGQAWAVTPTPMHHPDDSLRSTSRARQTYRGIRPKPSALRSSRRTVFPWWPDEDMSCQSHFRQGKNK